MYNKTLVFSDEAVKLLTVNLEFRRHTIEQKQQLHSQPCSIDNQTHLLALSKLIGADRFGNRESSCHKVTNWVPTGDITVVISHECYISRCM